VTDEPVHEAADPSDDGFDDEIDEAIVAAVSDYLDGALTGAARAEVAGKIAADPVWQRAHDELTRTRKVLSGMQKAHAPPRFADSVAQTIHHRSAGRLFARRTLGDRVPFGALLAVALAGLAVIAYVLWSSATGSLKVDHGRDRPPAAGSAAITPP
jgi:anti-sigma factor RsiW